jgi:hypothetical protein
VKASDLFEKVTANLVAAIEAGGVELSDAMAASLQACAGALTVVPAAGGTLSRWR